MLRNMQAFFFLKLINFRVNNCKISGFSHRIEMRAFFILFSKHFITLKSDQNVAIFYDLFSYVSFKNFHSLFSLAR